MANKTIYIVLVNKQVSQEAYQTLEEAQQFILSRLKTTEGRELALSSVSGFWNLNTLNGTQYQINDVRVK